MGLYVKTDEKAEEQEQVKLGIKKKVPKAAISKIRVTKKVKLGMFDISPHQLGQVEDSMIHFLDLQVGSIEYAVYFGYGNTKSHIVSSSLLLDPDDKSLTYNYFDSDLREQYGPDSESNSFGDLREFFHAGKLYFMYDFSKEAFFESESAVKEEFSYVFEVARNRALAYYVALLTANPGLVEVKEDDHIEDKISEELKANIFVDVIGSQARVSEKGFNPKDLVEKVYTQLRPAINEVEDGVSKLYRFVPKGMRLTDFGYAKSRNLSLSTMAQSNLKSKDVKIEDIAQMGVKGIRRLGRQVGKLSAGFDKIEGHLSWVAAYCQQNIGEDGEANSK